MTKEKQIEEMAKDLGIAFQLAGTTRFGAVAEVLVNAGYRKADEVIDEFAHGLKDFLHDAPVVYQAWFCKKIDTFTDIFKKKYTEEGK